MLAVLKEDFLYQLVFLLHILSVIVAFAPAFVWPLTTAGLRRNDDKVSQGVSAQIVRNSLTVHGPALVLVGLFGILMVVLSDEVFEFSQAWVSLAFLLWFALLAVVFGGIVPAERKVAAGDEEAERKIAMFGGISHLLLLVMLIVMIWKPGLG